MDLRFSDEDEAFRREVRDWLAEHNVGEFAAVEGRGGPGHEHESVDVRREWERVLGRAGWTCLGWPKEHGGRGATLAQQVIFNEEYVRVGSRTHGRDRRDAPRPDAHRVRHT